MKYKCSRCLETKGSSAFWSNIGARTGVHNYCIPCGKIRNKQWHLNNPKYDSVVGNRRPKSRQGHLTIAYKNAKSRIRLKKSYKGLYLLPRREFYRWGLSNESYTVLFNEWRAKNYEYGFSPSLILLNKQKGYKKGNIKFVTFSEAAKRRKNK